MNEGNVLDFCFGVLVEEDSSYQPVTLSDCTDLFAVARKMLVSEYISVVFPNALPDKYCLLVDDDASFNGRGVSAIGTYLFGHFMESVPLYGPFLIVKYHTNCRGEKEFLRLTKDEADEVVRCLRKDVVPHIKNALLAMLARKKKKEKFTVL